MEDMKDKYVFPNRIKPTNEEFRAYKRRVWSLQTKCVKAQRKLIELFTFFISLLFNLAKAFITVKINKPQLQ